MILDLIISERYVLLPDNFSLRLSFKFPLPYLDNIPAASTYWFTLPADDNNLIFKHANFVYGINKIKIYDCILVVAGNHMKGKLYLKNAKHREYKCFIVFNDIIEELSEKKISDVVVDTHFLGGDTDAIIAEAKNLSQQSYPGANYAFPVIYNNLYFSDKNQNYLDYGSRMNQYNSILQEFQKNYYSNGEVHNVNILVPMPYLFSIIDAIFNSIKFSVTGSVTEDINLTKLLYFNNVALQQSVAKDYAEVSRNQSTNLPDDVEFALVFTQEIKDVENRFHDNKYYCRNSEDYRVFLSFDIIGTIPAKNTYVLGLKTDGQSGYTSVDIQTLEYDERHIELSGDINLAIDSYTAIIEWSEWDAVGGTLEVSNIRFSMYPKSEFFIDRFAKQITLKDHVPNLTITDFLNSLIKKFTWAVFFSFENMTMEIESWSVILSNQNYLDLTDYFIQESENTTFENKQFSFRTEWQNDELIENNFKSTNEYTDIIEVFATPLPAPTSVGQIIFFKPANYYYVSVNSGIGELDWIFLTDNFRDVIIDGKDVQEIKTNISTLFSRLHPEGSLAEIKQVGSSIETGNNESGFKLLNYHGLDFYPFASNNKYDRNGNQVNGVNLQMHGEAGLYEIHAKEFYDYISSRDPIEMDFKINAVIFHKIANIFKAGNSVRKVRVGARNYIPETVDITISRNSFENCKMKLR